jgi:hypothetical protein
VTVGDMRSEGLEIVEGIEPGERVVHVGVSRMREDLVVRLPADA